MKYFSLYPDKTSVCHFKICDDTGWKIATYTGASRWVTGEAARAHVHRMRNRYHAIMVGVGTVLADDPMLTCRLGKQKMG